ncbi:MAG TPA: glutamine amidotransferase [Rhodobacteraceae bacterium]|jgi:GMP synthase-like glutamine amidotransferase|nr:glutamine amidotransferase [Paracoccaceae bacterium]HBV56137.1 glutamine amidotransferase [Paracoccaceae bacterium]
MKIGILQTGHVADEIRSMLGDYSDMFVRLLNGHGFDFVVYNVVDMDFPAGPELCDGWLITGSRHGAYEDHPFIPPLEALIRAIQETGRPLIGVCFGHQIIAQALGGKVEKFAGGWSVGRQEYTFDGETVALNAWHQDQVVDLPPGAKVVASSAFCANAALVYGPRIFTVQAHPEFTSSMVEGLIAHRSAKVPDALRDHARNALPTPTDNQRLASRMAAVLKGETQ